MNEIEYGVYGDLIVKWAVPYSTFLSITSGGPFFHP